MPYIPNKNHVQSQQTSTQNIDENDIKNNKYHKNELQDQINVWAN